MADPAPTEYPCDIERVATLWQEVLVEQIADKIAEINTRKSQPPILEEPENIYLGERKAEYFLDANTNWVILIYVPESTLDQEMDQGVDIDLWRIMFSIALRQESKKSTDAWKRLMRAQQAVREILVDNMTLEGKANPKDYNHLKEISFGGASLLDDLDVGELVFKQSQLSLQVRLAVGGTS